MNAAVDPRQARDFAVHVVEALQRAGYEAYWAGGCVRDALLGHPPTDYDVATNALPDEIRGVFGHHRTLAMGVAFGVITVVGPRRCGQVEVATFRADAPYSDGRHPDRVSYTTAEADAQRRDFTINGLFFDPVSNQVRDFVGGGADIERRIVRAIGDPHERIREDKLRMLRAVRFAATLDFELESHTRDAVRRHAAEIHVVSGERIAAEMRRLLVHSQRRRGVELLAATDLLPRIVPSSEWYTAERADPSSVNAQAWERTRAVLDRLRAPTFPVGLAALLRELCLRSSASRSLVATVARDWRLSRAEAAAVRHCLECELPLRTASRQPWPPLQRILIAPGIAEALCFAEAVALVLDGSDVEIEFCRARLAAPRNELDPAPLITGDDLRAQGIPPGPIYRSILERVRDEQLSGRVRDKNGALILTHQMWRAREPG